MLWRHILGYLPVNVVQGAVAFGTIMLLTRLLTPEEYGRYALVLATTHLVQMACFSWIQAGMARFFETARREGRLGRHFATGYLAYGALAAVVGASYTLVVRAAGFDPEVETALMFGLASLLLRGLLMLGLETHRAARDVRRFGAIEATHAILGLAVGVGLIMASDLRAPAPLLGLAVASLVCLVFDLPRVLVLARAAPAEERRPARRELRRFLAYGIPISLSLSLEFTLAAADRYLIGWFLGDAAVGVYAAGYALASRTLDIIFVWIAMAAMPLTIAAFEREGRASAIEVTRRNAETVVLIGFPAAAGLAAVAGPLASVMVGPEFREPAAAIVPWIAAAALMNGIMAHYVHNAFVLSQRTDLMAWLMVAPTLVNVALNLLLIPRLGLTGAVVATVVAYGLALLLATVVGRRHFPLPLVPGTALRGAAAAAVMALAVWLVPGSEGVLVLLAKMAVGIVVYAALVLLLDIGGCRGWAGAIQRRRVLRAPG